MTLRAKNLPRPRHDAKFSPAVMAKLTELLTAPGRYSVAGTIVDPFAGIGLIDELDRDDVAGIEIEPEWADASDVVICGDALDSANYPEDIGSIVTSITYGNRMAGNYLGPKCKICAGSGTVPVSGRGSDGFDRCEECDGIGHDTKGRFGYAISLGRPVSEDSSAQWTFGPKWQRFHRRWLVIAATVLPHGDRRLILNVSDHYVTPPKLKRTNGPVITRPEHREYVCAWVITAAWASGFRLAEAHHIETPRIGRGPNRDARAPDEMILVFDYPRRPWRIDSAAHDLQAQWS